ncbi:MAG: mechanosensitive ion channel domain-containing protein [archaeon]
MLSFNEIFNLATKELSWLKILVVVVILITVFNVFLSYLKKYLLRKTRSKKQVSNVKIFTRILSATFAVLIIVLAFFSYTGSWTSLSLVVGLLTAALGFALQKPITGIAAWVMVIIKRPFNIGDRIVIGDVRGEVYDITLTHVYIDEVGGLIESDLPSGRNIMVPNHLLFEHNIINYTLTNDYVLGEVVVEVTYESNLDKAMQIVSECTLNYVNEYVSAMKREPKIRIKAGASGVVIRSLFYAPINVINQVTSNITKEIHERFFKEKDVEFAYPHTEIIFKDKKLFKKS